jgi:hypothetical protein
MTLPFTLKKKIYENPNIFHHAKFRIFPKKKNTLKETKNPSRYYYNSRTNPKVST